MSELIILGLAIGAVMSLMMSAVLLRLGVMIDRFPLEREQERELSLWSPIQFTRISVMTYWPLYIVGGYMMFQPGKLMLIGGIALIFGLVLFLITAVLFSAAVYNLMRSGSKMNGIPSPLAGVTSGMSGLPAAKIFSGVRMQTSGKFSRAGVTAFKK